MLSWVYGIDFCRGVLAARWMRGKQKDVEREEEEGGREGNGAEEKR